MSVVPVLFGEKLQYLRNERGWTQDVLGTHLKRTQAYISKLESGSKPPTVELTLRLANLFDVSTDYLLLDSVGVARTDDTQKRPTRRLKR